MNISDFKKYDKSEKLEVGDKRYLIEGAVLIEIEKKSRRGFGNVVSKKKKMKITNKSLLERIKKQLG